MQVVGVVVVACLLIGVPLVQLRFTSYRLSRHELEVLLFGFVVRRVMLGDIDEVRVGGRLWTEFWPNREMFSGGFLTVRRKRSFIRHLTLTPTNPEELRANIYYALGWNPRATRD